MSAQDCLPWARRVTTAVRLSQSKTLADLVAAAGRLDRISLAWIGRHMAGSVAAQHTSTRAGRFTGNGRVAIAATMAGVLGRRTRPRTKRRLVRRDGTAVRDFHPRRAAASGRGRAGPRLGASDPEWPCHRRQNRTPWWRAGGGAGGR